MKDHLHNKVEFYDDRVIKTGRPDLIYIEAEKTIRGYEIGHETGLFRVPKVIDCDKQEGVLVLERICGLSCIREVVRGKYNPDVLGENIGRCLAIVHNELTLPEYMRKGLPPELAPGGQNVFLHGDFNVTNICIGRNDGVITILDWQMTDVHGGEATYGSNYFDMSFFINTSFSRPFYEYGRIPVFAMLNGFLKGYIEMSKFSWDEDGFIAYLEKYFRLKMKFRKENMALKERLLFALGHRLWSLFIRNRKSKCVVKN